MIARINQLRKEKDAIILAHNYQAVDIQDLADYKGDSLQLSILASKSRSRMIVFCGVRFMAETAAILNPEAKVVLPVLDAGCPMADMITAEQLRAFKALHPGAAVVCYVNSSVEVKAESDICCTSSNALNVIRSIPADQEILFVPDQNLGTWAAAQADRKVIVYNGYCPVHQFSYNLPQVMDMRAKHPDFTILAHPECPKEVVAAADKVMSTSGMMSFVEANDKVIIATEQGMVDYLIHLYPHKQILPLNPMAICKNMKKTRLEDLLNALETESHHITVAPEIAARAIGCLDKMLEITAR